MGILESFWVKFMMLKWFNGLHVLNDVRWDQDTSSTLVVKNVEHFGLAVHTEIWTKMTEKW